MRERTRPLVAALSFLTVVPVARGVGKRDLRRGVALFPVVGAAVSLVKTTICVCPFTRWFMSRLGVGD